ncbi:metallophosphoesterase family protein [Amycolatopsis jiangsuensis]|uniref:Putative phosphoesterase n=1 Tax=Amycolatopsis jiangsuensis TaxID=1181879 RepID=A0A840IS81_9PSEU|nr:metallophosphoesterase family protein [Amycolatopsis jiangsuensis]MBB4684683.1 putative phosphoesterase [Amycolatopsis jiangsuensis]
MVSSVAVLSDVHGMLPALEAVLAEPDVAAAEVVVLCGDHAAGPLPRRTLDRLAGLGDRAKWLRGNADRELVTLAAGGGTTIADPIAPWAAGDLRPDQLALLAGLPLSLTIEVTGLGEVLFCHATPRDDEEVVLVDSPPARWAEVLAGSTAETVVCGHTHMPFVRLADRRRIVNPGSVGMPYGTTGAHWALLGPGVQLRRTEYDAEAACRELENTSGYPGISVWADEFVRNPASDVEVLRVFSPLARGTSAT